MSRTVIVRAAIVLVLATTGTATTIAQPAMPEVGRAVPDFTLPALDGDMLTLSESRAEGPVVLVFFRGAW